MLRLERQFGLRGVVFQLVQLVSVRQDIPSCFQKWHVICGYHHLFCASRFCSGTRLFILYTADLADVVMAHNVNLQSYVDDSQLYLRCQRQHMTTAGQRLELCITDVRHWMAANRLKLNADKTELLWAGSK